MKEKKIRRNQNKGVRMERKGGKIWKRKKGELCSGPSWAQKLTNGPSM